MDLYQKFKAQGDVEVAAMASDESLQTITQKWLEAATVHNYSYHFEWMGRPIIQFPQDIVALQETIWSVKPDLIIETGIAHGGSLVLSASILALLDLVDLGRGEGLTPTSTPARKVLGIDIDVRRHNRDSLDNHAMRPWIEMIEGSSVDPDVVSRVHNYASKFNRILVMLDSNHTEEHVLSELEAYCSLVSPESYIIVYDTVIEHMPTHFYPDRSWGRGNNPKTAVKAFLENHPEFEIDAGHQKKLLISVCPDGFLRRIS